MIFVRRLNEERSVSVNRRLPHRSQKTSIRIVVWTETTIGLQDGQKLTRKRPTPFGDAALLLAKASGLDAKTCATALEHFLTRVSQPEDQRGGSGDKAFLAFKLHRFISCSGKVFTTLRNRPRHVYLEGQLEYPEQPGDRLYPTRFCRSCGQEFHVVSLTEKDGSAIFVPRSIDDTPNPETEGDLGG